MREKRRDATRKCVILSGGITYLCLKRGHGGRQWFGTEKLLQLAGRGRVVRLLLRGATTTATARGRTGRRSGRGRGRSGRGGRRRHGRGRILYATGTSGRGRRRGR